MKKKLFGIIGLVVVALIGIAVIGFNYTGSYTSQFTGPYQPTNHYPGF